MAQFLEKKTLVKKIIAKIDEVDTLLPNSSIYDLQFQSELIK